MIDMVVRTTKHPTCFQAEHGVVSQQFGMRMNATNNAIKTVGEAMDRMTSKQ